MGFANNRPSQGFFSPAAKASKCLQLCHKIIDKCYCYITRICTFTLFELNTFNRVFSNRFTQTVLASRVSITLGVCEESLQFFKQNNRGKLGLS